MLALTFTRFRTYNYLDFPSSAYGGASWNDILFYSTRRLRKKGHDL